MQYEFFLLEFLEHFEFKCVGCFDPYKNLSRKDNFCDRKVKANCACVLPFNTPFCLGTCALWRAAAGAELLKRVFDGLWTVSGKSRKRESIITSSQRMCGYLLQLHSIPRVNYLNFPQIPSNGLFLFINEKGHYLLSCKQETEGKLLIPHYLENCKSYVLLKHSLGIHLFISNDNIVIFVKFRGDSQLLCIVHIWKL